MKLYYSPGVCSLAPHIALREADIGFDMVKVNLATKKTEAGQDFGAVTAKGYVPVLELDDGYRMSEVAAILQYLVALAPQKNLAPQVASRQWFEMLEWLTYISAELHKRFSPLFRPDLTDERKEEQRRELVPRLAYVAEALTRRSHLGEAYSIADIYLFTVLNWAQWAQVDLSPWTSLQQYCARIAARSAVRAALRAEGLHK
jgi:glutathione S-transferase